MLRRLAHFGICCDARSHVPALPPRWRVGQLVASFRSQQQRIKRKMARSKGRKRKLYIILNGKKSGDSDLRTAISNLREEGHDIEVRVTYEDGDSDRIVREALKSKDVDVIVAAGGDGSVNQLAGALLKADAPSSTAMGIVPMGTANDFATAAGIPTDPWEALQLAVHDTAHPIDVGTVNEEVFMNIATGGFGTEITAQTDEGMKNSLGGAAYLLTGISKPGSISARKATARVPLTALTKKGGGYKEVRDVKIEEDGLGEVKQIERKGKKERVAEFSGDLLVLAVGNSRQAGGGHQLCPDALLDDGLLDVSYVLNLAPEQIGGLIQNLMDSSKSVSEMPEVFGTLRCDWLDVNCPDELQVNCDGEPMRDVKYSFGVLPKRLRLHLPETRLLQASAGRTDAAPPQLHRTSPQHRFMRRINSLSRPQFEDRNVAKIKGIATQAAKVGLVFGTGAVVGVMAQRRGWFGTARIGR